MKSVGIDIGSSSVKVAELETNGKSFKVNSFNEYIEAKKTIIVFDANRDKDYFKHKFFTFIHLLLYSEIESDKICNGDIQTDKIFCLRSDLGELQFYSIYEQSQLQLMLLSRMKLEINFKSSNILKKEVKLNLQIRVN